MATVRTIEVSACGKRCVNYQTNEVNVSMTLDLAEGDDPVSVAGAWQLTLQNHVEQAFAEWGTPGQVQPRTGNTKPPPPPWKGQQ